MAFDYTTYLSPFTWRYGSPEMRQIWSEMHKRQLWRELWCALAEVQAEFGLVNPEWVSELRQHADSIDLPRALEIEAEIHHDLMAELKAFAEQSPRAGGILHLGATSTDIEDNADVLRMRQALDLVLERLCELLRLFASLIESYADTVVMAFTHLQPAEPTTLGYRLAQYAQDLLLDWDGLQHLRQNLRGKGFKGAVGTGASYVELLGGIDRFSAFEARLSERLNLSFYSVTTQVYPRKQDYQVIGALAGLGGSLYKFAFDLRLLQSPVLGEVSEPFKSQQIGSSAMPFKRNPINAEKIDSLARALAQMPRTAWDNAAHSLLERTLDDSANRRSLLPEAFLITDELLCTARRVLGGLQVNESAMQSNLMIYGPFAGVERLLMGLVKAGADRQKMHERLRGHSLTAWQALQDGKPNPLVANITGDSEIQQYLTEEQIRTLLEARLHIGDAPQRARALAREIQARF